MYDKERGLYIAHCANGALSITGKMANRHGLIAGATGTGKTVTLQVMAETFCQAGVPCFMADMKGDLSGISQVGSSVDSSRSACLSSASRTQSSRAVPYDSSTYSANRVIPCVPPSLRWVPCCSVAC